MRVSSFYRKESKKEVLNSKKEILKDVRKQFLQNLERLNPTEREEMFKIIIKRAKEVFKFEKIFIG